jgi:hypothetical protein
LAKYILLGEPAFGAFRNELESRGFTPISLPSDTRLNSIVASHPDTLIFEYCGQMIINSAYLSRLCLPDALINQVISTDDYPFGEYPEDVRFNALVLRGSLYARKASLSYAIKNFAEENKLEIIDVSQGYVRCSVLALPSANRAITADEGLARAMEKRGVRVLRISAGGIKLSGCDYGFIGGASFVDDPLSCCSLHSKPSVYFFGSIASHPDSIKILQFCAEGGYNTISLSGELTDYGGGLVIY